MTASGATVRRMRSDEVGAVAELHRRAFPAYVSTKLGAGYCRRMLRAFAQDPDAWIDVAVEEDGQIVGFLVAAPPPAQREVERALLPWAAVNAYRHPGDLVRNVRRAVTRLTRRSSAGRSGGVTDGASVAEQDGAAVEAPARARHGARRAGGRRCRCPGARRG